MECKDLAIDLMHLSTNEIQEIKNLPVLTEHIKKCPDCQKKLGELIDVDVFSFLARPRSPEYQTKMKKLIERVRSESGEKPTDVKVEIDSAAGKIYDYLKNNGNGEIPIPKLRDETGLVDYPFYEAMSWLVMNDKATYTKDQDNRPAYVSPR